MRDLVALIGWDNPGLEDLYTPSRPIHQRKMPAIPPPAASVHSPDMTSRYAPSTRVPMHYQPGRPLTEVLATTPDAVATRAADIVATTPESVDAISEATQSLPAGVPQAVRWQLIGAVETMADRIARNRHPRIGELLGSGPVPWSCWQHELDEPWPILADTAAHLGKALPHRTSAVTGSWSITAQ